MSADRAIAIAGLICGLIQAAAATVYLILLKKPKKNLTEFSTEISTGFVMKRNSTENKRVKRIQQKCGLYILGLQKARLQEAI